ncbi:hypothetical protein [Candidatus Palauibacter sp.]|uniref:hypothetical protein n=1 Tax=Candidatus Palauibacter sp. TaxID=3101350 RepID=UPI003B019585
MNKIPRWLIAAAVILSVGLLMPSVAEAQGGMDCATCNNLTGICEGDQDPDDRCYQGIDWEELELFCASWGSLMDCEIFIFNDIGADGALPGVARFASVASASHELTVQGPASKYVRDCKSARVAS